MVAKAMKKEAEQELRDLCENPNNVEAFEGNEK